MTKYICILLTAVLICSCGGKNDSKKSILPDKKKGFSTANITNNKVFDLKIYPGENLPDACALVNTQTIASIFNVPANIINIIDGNIKGDITKSRTCFFKWDVADFPNNGLFVQVEINPVPEESPDFPSQYVANKRGSGENYMQEDGGQKNVSFYLFEGIGNDGSYSYEAGRYYWRLNNDFIFTMAFNMDITEERQYETASILAKEITAHFTK